MKAPLSAQRGMTLLVTMIMLIVITMFVVSTVKLGNTNATIVANMRAQKSVDAEAQQQIEIALNQFQFFDDTIQAALSATSTGGVLWAAAPTDASGKSYLTATTLWNTYKPTGATTAPATQTLASNLWIYRPQCVFFQPATGYSALSGVAPQDTFWDMQAVATDSNTGASTEIHQGIQIRLPAGNCS